MFDSYVQDIKFSSYFKAEFFKIEATDFYLEPNAILDCAGRGFITETIGSGQDSASGGSGAGHGTPGGDGQDVSGGEEVGSVYEPVLPGARGGTRIGSAAGSRGGGRVRVVVGFAFRLDGSITVDGDNAVENSGKVFKIEWYGIAFFNFKKTKSTIPANRMLRISSSLIPSSLSLLQNVG